MALKTIKGTLEWSDRTDWLYPADDIGTLDWPFRLGAGDVEDALKMMAPYLNGKRTCIQAGGAIGIWPLRLAQVFQKVLTYEPEETNFLCLVNNTKGIENIDRRHAALGCEHTRVKMVLPRIGHCGAWQAMPGGSVPTVLIDDLRLNDVDLIYLDIEGAEYSALEGARETIRRCGPVIGIEQTGLGRNPHKLLVDMGYQFIGHPQRNDKLYAPATS